MKFHPRQNLLLLASTLLALTLAACGSKEPEELEAQLECGPGTVLSEERCVLADFDCPDGEVPLPAGGCAEPSIFCSGSTTYDVELERCVAPDRIECGEGTVAVDNRCLVMDAMTCGDGTVLADGECRLAASVCGVGTILDGVQCEPTARACGPMTIFDVVEQSCVYLGTVECGEDTIEDNNRCVPLHTFVDELAMEATVDYSDPPANRVIDPGNEIGNRVVFKGAMTGSTGFYHVFSLNVVPGQWLKVTVYPQGIPSVGFRARTVFTEWDRKVPAGKSAIASRYLAPITGGQQDLIIETSLSGTGASAGIADSSWTYVGVVEVVEPPESTSWDDVETTYTGDMHDRSSSFIQVPLQADEAILVTPQAIAPGIEKPVIEIWESPTKFRRTAAIAPGEPFRVSGVEGQSSVYLRFDATTLHSPDAEFRVRAQHSYTLDGGLAMETEVQAQAGQMLFFSHESSAAEPVAVQILRGEELLYSQDILLARNKSGSFGSKESNQGFFYIHQDGTYQVRFENTSFNNYEDFFPSLAVQDIPTFKVSEGERTSFEAQLEGQDLLPGQWRFVVIDLDESAYIEGTSSTSKGSPQLSIYNTQNEELQSYTATGARNFEFDVYAAQTLILAFRPTSTSTTVSNIEVELSSAPNNLLPPQEVHREIIDASLFDILTGTIKYRSGGAPTVRLLNPDEMIVFETVMTSMTLELFELMPGDGEFVLEILNKNEEPTVDLEVAIDLTTPVDQLNFHEPTTGSLPVTEPLEKGKSQLILMRATEELKYELKAIAADDDERLTLQLQDLQSFNEVGRHSGAGEAQLQFTNLPAELYLMEVIAETDLEQGFTVEWVLEIPTIRSATGGPINIPSSSSSVMDYYTDQVTIGACAHVDDIKVEIKKGSGLYNYDLEFVLESPAGDKVMLLEYSDLTNTTAARTFSYPDVDTPKEPMTPFLDKSGEGVWTLTVGYKWSNAGQIEEWTLTVDCS